MPTFPLELLNANNEKKKEYFRDCIVHHKNLDEAIDETMMYISSLVDERIILICGPSGVGKQELINGIKQKIIETEESKSNKTTGFIPIVEVEAIAPVDGSFNFPSLWISALEELCEPLLERKISYAEVEGCDKKGNRIIMSKVKKADYEQVLINTLKYRHVKAMIINEAHHMLMIATTKKANWSVNVLKSLASCRIPIVLVGTYELLRYWELESGYIDQSIRRTKTVNFPRYYQGKEGLRYFGAAAKDLILNMPFKEIDPTIISENLQYLFEYSLGRIGALKIWLMDAYSYALDRQAELLTRKHLDATRIPGYLRNIVLDGIEDGENQMSKFMSDGYSNNSPVVRDENASSILSKCTTTKNRQPFKRNPKRDVANEGLINTGSNGGNLA